jgi:hypothetical protein
MVTYLGGKILKSFKSGLIVIGELPRWKEYEKRSYCYRWPTHTEKEKVVSL